MKQKRRFDVKMYPVLALLIVRGAIQATDLERKEAQNMILEGPQSGQDYYGSLKRKPITHEAQPGPAGPGDSEEV